MSANQFGSRFSLVTFGESHGPAMGVVIDGCPAGVNINFEQLQIDLNRRRPGFDPLQSARQEEDKVEVLSGIHHGKTLGTPIAMVIRNHDQRSSDYENISVHPRPGHADDTWMEKFSHVDLRGGGRSSGRETVSRVMAGSLAKQFVQQFLNNHESPSQARNSQSSSGPIVFAFSERIGPLQLLQEDYEHLYRGLIKSVDSFAARFPSPSQQDQVKQLLLNAKATGESFGGHAQALVHHLPTSLGQPVFHKLKADLANALMGIGAVVGVEFGAGFAGVTEKGSHFHKNQTGLQYGGIRGGISTGEPIQIRIAFKPTASIYDIAKMGRHDPCIIPRALPVLEAMIWLVIADHLLWRLSDQI